MYTNTLRKTIAAASLLAGLATAALPDYRLVRVESRVEIKASPEAVWSALFSARGQAALGFAPDKPGQILAEGHPVHGSCGSDKGNLVVTHAEKGKELRVHFDPDHGGYVCRTALKIEPTAGGARLAYSDWYSEEKPDMEERNRADTQAAADKGLQALKSLIESGESAKSAKPVESVESVESVKSVKSVKGR